MSKYINRASKTILKTCLTNTVDQCRLRTSSNTGIRIAKTFPSGTTNCQKRRATSNSRTRWAMCTLWSSTLWDSSRTTPLTTWRGTSKNKTECWCCNKSKPFLTWCKTVSSSINRNKTTFKTSSWTFNTKGKWWMVAIASINYLRATTTRKNKSMRGSYRSSRIKLKSLQTWWNNKWITLESLSGNSDLKMRPKGWSRWTNTMFISRRRMTVGGMPGYLSSRVCLLMSNTMKTNLTCKDNHLQVYLFKRTLPKWNNNK